MTECRRFLNFAIEHSRPEGSMPPAIEQHLQVCRGCRGLWRWLRADLTGPSPAAIERIQRSLPRVESVKPMGPNFQRAAGFALAFLCIFGAGVFYFGWDGFRRMELWQSVPWLAALGVSTALLAVNLGRQMEPGLAGATGAWPLIGVICLTFVVLSLSLFPWSTSTRPWRWDIICLLGGVVLSTPAGIVNFLLARRSPIPGPEAFAAGASLSALSGVALVESACFQIDALHQLSHVLPISVGASLGCLISHLRFSRNLLPNPVEET